MHKEYILLNGFRKAKKGFTAGFHVPLRALLGFDHPHLERDIKRDDQNQSAKLPLCGSEFQNVYQSIPSQPTAAGRRRRISGYERRWAAILPAITRQRAAAVKTDHVICHLKRWNCLQRAFSGPLMSKWSVSGVFLNILKTFRNNHDRKN